MNGSSVRTRSMTPLALMAALLLALVPTASRIIASVVPAPHAIVLELCTGAGTHSVDASPLIAVEGPSPAAAAASTNGEACSYCALLPLTLLVLLPMRAWLPHALSATLAHATGPILRWPRNLRGLGSQAPPLAL